MSEYDFSGLRYNFAGVNGPLLKHFPELKNIPGLTSLGDEYRGIPIDQIIKYMILMYDPGSPILEPNLMNRKSICAIVAGFQRGRDGRFSVDAEDIIMMTDQKFAEVVIGFVNSFHSATYSKLVAFKQHYDNLLRQLLDPKKAMDIKVKEVDELERNINEMQSRLLRDTAPKLVEMLYEKVATDQLLLRPEDIAEKIDAGENPVDVQPYGPEYDITKKYAWKGTKLLKDMEKA